MRVKVDAAGSETDSDSMGSKPAARANLVTKSAGLGCDVTVSAHLLVRRDGSLIQFVPFYRRAWHAGESCFRGQGRCNDYSIGIELEGVDDVAYDKEQYETLIAVTKALTHAYPDISARTIAAHSDIAPGRKTDPGPAFDWFRLYDGLQDV